MMYYIYMFISIIGDCMITIRHRIVQSFKDVWKPAVIFMLLFAICIALHVIAISVISMFTRRNKRCVKMNNFFRRVSIQTLDLVMRIMRIKLRVSGMEMIPENKRFLLICNHLSVFDPIIAMRTFSKNEVAFISKKENVEIPFIGRLMTASGCLALDRDNNRDAVRTIRQASNQITDDISSMGIYPEGGINKTDKILLPFHRGSFKIAKNANSPIVVTTIKNTEKICRRFFFSATDVYLDVIRVIQPEEVSSMSTAELSEMVWNIMHRHISEQYVDRSEAEGQEAAC